MILVSVKVSVFFCMFLSIFVKFFLFLFVSVHFCLFLSVSVCFCLFLSVSVCLCLFLLIYVCLCLFLSFSVHSVSVCEFLSVIVHFFPFLSVYVRLCPFLSAWGLFGRFISSCQFLYICVHFWRAKKSLDWSPPPGLRHNRIKNTNSKIKHIQIPCLVQTEALFDEDRGLSLQEWASIGKIQRLCLATQRPCLVKQTWCIVFNENTRTYFLNVSNRYLFPQTPFPFLSFTGCQNQFYLDLLDQWGLCLADKKICLKTLYNTCACLTLHKRYLSYKTDHLFYQTRHLSLPNRAKQSI